MNTMTDHLTMSDREYFASVAARPGMFVGRPSFHALTAFITGYDEAARRLGAPGLRGLREWLVAYRGRDCNHAWPGQVLHIAIPGGWEDLWALAPDVEARAIEVLFDLLDRFLAVRDGSADLGTG